MNERNETYTREGSQVTIQPVSNGYVVDIWENGFACHPTRYVFGTRVQLASWIASEMPKAKWEEGA